MIMQSRQVGRFLKLFDSLLRFCATDLKVPGVHMSMGISSENDDEVSSVICAIWGEKGDRSSIDRFVEANPDGLNRTDLREVATWKEGLYEGFSAIRDGANVYLILGDYAFAVRGLGYEFDEDLDFIPTFVETLLLPFDGIITFGLELSCYTDELSWTDREMMRVLLEECKSARNVARTSRQFMQMAPLALESMRRYDEGLEAMMGQDGLVGLPLGTGTHESVLARLGWDERQRAIDAHLEMLHATPAARIAQLLDEKSVSGIPATTFREFLYNESMPSIQDLARRLEIRSSSRRGGKNRLVQDIYRRLKIDEELVATSILMCGSGTAAWVRRCHEAGGRVTFGASDIEDPKSVPVPAPPTFMVYRNEGTYTAVILDEAKPVLAEMDLDELVEKAEAIDEAVAYVDLAVDFRGAMGIVDAVDECVDVLGFKDSEDLLGHLMMRVGLDGVGYMVAPIDNGLYVVDTDLAELEEDSYIDNLVEESVIEVLEVNEVREVRPVAELMGTYDSVWAWVRSTPAYQAFARYLDAHVPDGIDDYLFADKAGEEILFFARRMDERFFYSDALGELKHLGYEPKGEEYERVCDLLEGYYNATPKWLLGGWAPNEVGLNV